MYNICDYGAIGDGVTLNTSAIQNAIDDCNKNGGGQVYVPPGTFKSGTIWLKSNVELHISRGGVLLASDKLDDYNDLDAYEQNWCYEPEMWNGSHFIIAHEVENVAITGLGEINGNCYAFLEDDFNHEQWYRWRCGSYKLIGEAKERLRPGQLVVFIECKHVDIRDVTVKDSPCWSMYFYGCDYVNVCGYKAFNRKNIQCTDGMDIDSCKWVNVTNCYVETGDDGITLRGHGFKLKNGVRTCEYVTISNCIINCAICAFRIGVGTGAIKHVGISNITVTNCRELMQYATSYLGHGSVDIEDFNINGILAQSTDRAISMYASNNASIKDITIENVRSTATQMSYIHDDGGHIENIRLRNFEINAYDRYEHLEDKYIDMRGHHVFSVKGAKNLVLEDVRVKGDFSQRKERIVIDNCENLDERHCDYGPLK